MGRMHDHIFIHPYFFSLQGYHADGNETTELNLLIYYDYFSAQSNNINKSRMTLLLTRQQMLDDLFAESRTQLLTVTKDPTRYEKFLSDSILQVLLHTLGGDNMITTASRNMLHARFSLPEAVN